MIASPHLRPMTTALILLALFGAGCVQAAQVAPSKASRNAPSTSVTFIDAPSSEKPAAREKRLRRECRGRPNAGMCLGYTR